MAADNYIGVRPPHGTPHLCGDCRQPGIRQRCRSCSKIVEREDGDTCTRCKKCIAWGTKESDELCQACIASGEPNCWSCRRRPMPGSAFCMFCETNFKTQVVDAKGSPLFPENTAPAGDAPDGSGVYNPPITADAQNRSRRSPHVCPDCLERRASPPG
jgi:hypothetical protein